MTQAAVGSYALGDFVLQSGIVLSDAFMGYQTFGALNSRKDNVIVFPTWYTGTHDQVTPYVGKDKALDPDKYFIVVPDMFTNGNSTSPSNASAPHRGLNFPLVTPAPRAVPDLAPGWPPGASRPTACPPSAAVDGGPLSARGGGG